MEKIKGLGVNVIYRNDKLEPVCEKTYPLEDYTDMLKTDQLRLITDVEDAFYMANGSREKDEWTDVTWSAFIKIKHKLLDKAGAIGRLPDGLVKYDDVPQGSE